MDTEIIEDATQEPLKDKAEELTREIVDRIYERTVKGFYENLDGSLKCYISQSNFQKLLSRLKKSKEKGKNLSKIRDSESGLTIRISQSQLFTYGVLKELGINAAEFFELPITGLPRDTEAAPVNSIDNMVKDFELLNEKLDFITECVNKNRRASCKARFSDLYKYTLSMENSLPIFADDMKKNQNPCNQFAFMFFIMEEIKKFGFRGNELFKKVCKIGTNDMRLDNSASLTLYALFALMLFLKKFKLFVSSYKSSHLRTMKSVLIFEDSKNPLNELENKNMESDFIGNRINPLYKAASQIIDADRINIWSQSEKFMSDFTVNVNNLFKQACEIFFRAEMVTATVWERYLQTLFNFSFWSQENSNYDYTRLYITRSFIEAIEKMEDTIEYYDAEDGEEED